MINPNELFSSVSSLLALSRPSDVSWFVIPIIIYSVYGVGFARWISDVSIETFERGFPFRVNFNASPPVVLEMLFSRIPATLVQVLPSFVHFSVRHSVGRPSFRSFFIGVWVFLVHSIGVFFNDASARFSEVVLKRGSNNPLLIPTSALAQPITLTLLFGWVRLSGFEFIGDRESSPNQTGEIVHAQR